MSLTEKQTKLKKLKEQWQSLNFDAVPGKLRLSNLFRSPSIFYLLTAGVEVVLFSLDHTQTHTTVGRTPLDEGLAYRRDLYLTTQTLYKRQTSMPLVEFEATTPASAWPQTCSSDRVATGIGGCQILRFNERYSYSLLVLYEIIIVMYCIYRFSGICDKTRN
jgi:hypothetical protein